MVFKVVGHRGNPSQYPENTIASFVSALKCGSSGVETDIQITRDKEIVIFHDDDMKRLTGEPGMIGQYTLAELKEMRVLGTDEAIPTLQEFLDSTNGIERFIELKARNEKGERINTGLEKYLNSFFHDDYTRDIHFISFDIEAIRNMKEYNRNYSVGLDIGRETSLIWDSMMKDHIPDFLDFVIPEYSIIENEDRDLGRNSSRIIPWVVNEPEKLETLKKKGIDAFMTDMPCLMAGYS